MSDEKRERIRYFGFAGIVGILLLLYVRGVFTTVFGIDLAAILTVLAGYRIFYNSISALLEKEISADLAICIAVIAALWVGEYAAAAEAMFIMLLGEGLEAYAAGRTSAAISKFVEQMPRRARLIRDGEEIEVDAATLAPDDEIAVRGGERIPADGYIVAGTSSVDESTITGESLPRDKESGDEVYSGTLNGGGLLRIRVSRAGSDTTLARVIGLVAEAKENRAPVERLADRYARYFLPALLLAAIFTFYFTRDWTRTVAVLLVACPCALILATPTAMVAAIGGLARRGILVRGGTVLQLAAKVDTIVFDKTGTVTEGSFEILKILPVKCSEEEVLALAAVAESGSTHVLARVIVDEALRRNIEVAAAEEAAVIPGRGVECRVNGRTVRAGNAGFVQEHSPGQQHDESDALLAEADRLGATAVLVSDDGALVGAILLRDRIRAGAKEAIAELKELDITYQVMLTGDRRRAADVIARELGIPNVEADLLPEQKLDRVRQLGSQGRFVGMVGEGLNDAPAMAAAHVGIAVKGASDVTAEAADVVYLGHSLEKLPRLFDVSRKAVATAWQNIIVFAGLLNVMAVLAAGTGVIGPLGAAFTHQISSFFVMLNSLRLLRVEREAGRPGWISRIAEKLRITEVWGTVREVLAKAQLRSVYSFASEHRPQLQKTALAILVVLAVSSGMYIVNPDEVAVIQRFGRKVMPVREPGLHYKLPWPVDTLTRIQAKKIRVVEVGFRSTGGGADTEPPSYEWNAQHRSGRFQRKPDEALMLAGDQNMMEVNATVHYRISRPDDFLFGQLDGESTVRSATESAIQSVTSTAPLEAVLTSGRKEMEGNILRALQERLDRYSAGVEVLHVKLLDVHPSLEVVDAFREVSGAFEEKNRLINEAEGYRNEQVALARGNAEARLAAAKGYSTGRVNRADGDASRFRLHEEAYKGAPGLNSTRLYLETMEQILPGKKKMIVDATKGRRHLVLMEDGVEIGAAAAPLMQPRRRSPFEEQEEK